MYTAVIEFYALADPVGTAAENHDLGPGCADRVLIRRVVGGVVVSAVLSTAYVNAFPRFLHTDGDTAAANGFLRNLEQLA